MTGPGMVTLAIARSNTCDGRTRYGLAYIAGRVIRLAQDGTALGTNCGL